MRGAVMEGKAVLGLDLPVEVFPASKLGWVRDGGFDRRSWTSLLHVRVGALEVLRESQPG